MDSRGDGMANRANVTSEAGPVTHGEETLNTQVPQQTASDTLLREADLRDEIASIDRSRSRIVVGWTILVVIAGVALFQAPAQYAVLPLLPFLTFKRAMLKYEKLGSRKSALLGSLDVERGLQES